MRHGTTASVLALAVPPSLWFLCMVTGEFFFGPLGFMALFPSGLIAVICTSVRSQNHPQKQRNLFLSIAIFLVAGAYLLLFTPFALILLMRLAGELGGG